MNNLLIIEDVVDVNAMLCRRMLSRFNFQTQSICRPTMKRLIQTSFSTALSEKLGGKALATIENGMITFHIELRKKLQLN